MGSGFRDVGFSNAKPSYSRGIKTPSSRHSGLVGDQSSYPSNSRDVLYGDAFYPASPDDYYYAADGLAGPAGHSAGYGPQAPVDYDYYNMAPGQSVKLYSHSVNVTHASGSRCVSRVISGICDFVCLFVCLRS